MTETTVVSIPLDTVVVVEGANPRTTFDPAAIKELANSIKSIGLLNPITVRWSGSETEERYDLVAGHRRYLAVSTLEATHIDAIVHDADWSDGAIAAVAENVARADLNPVDEARAYQELMTEGKLKVRALSQLVGRSEKRIKERVALLALPDSTLELMAAGKLSPRVAPTLFPVAKLSRDVAAWLAIVASQSSYATEILVHNLPGALKDLRKDVLGLDPEATPPFVLQATGYMASENREILRRVVSDELAGKIGELPQFCAMDPWRFDDDDGDAAVAYGAAIDLSHGHFRTVFILDPEWAADRVAVNYEHALKRALEHAKATEKAKAPGGHEHVHVQEREATKAKRKIEDRLAPRVHERNAAIGRALMKHKFKADPMAIKLLAVLAAAHLNSTPASAWALVDESIGEPQITTRKDGTTKFKLVVSATPYQLQQDLVERVHEAKTVPQLLRLILGPIIAGSVVDGRSVTQSNRPARLNFDNIAGTQDVKEYLVELARQFDFEKPYEVPKTEEEKAAEKASSDAIEAQEAVVAAAQQAAMDAEAAYDSSDDDEQSEELKALADAAEAANLAWDEAEAELNRLYNEGPAGVAGGESGDDDDEAEEDDSEGTDDAQPAIALPNDDDDTEEHDTVPEDAGDVVPDPLDPDDVDPDEAALAPLTAEADAYLEQADATPDEEVATA